MRFATTRHTIATSCAPPLFHLFPSCGAVFDKRRRFQHDIAHTLLASPFSYIEAMPASIPASLYTCLPFFRYVGTGPLLNGPNTLCGLMSQNPTLVRHSLRKSGSPDDQHLRRQTQTYTHMI